MRPSWWTILFKRRGFKIDPQFEHRFAREIAKTELLRVNLQIWLIILGFITGLINFFALREKAVYEVLLSAMGLLFSFVSGMIIYEIICRFYILSRIRKRLPVSKAFRIANLLIETSFPTGILMLLAMLVNNIVIFFSPFILLYFLFIILSTLHLDFWMSALSGLFAAAQYFFCVSVYC